MWICDEAVAIDNLFIHSEVVAAMPDQLAGLLERPFIEQQIDSFAGGEFPFGVLPLAPFITPTRLGRRVPPAQLFETVLSHI